MVSHRYIAIEGPIGVGKTTLAAKLADYLGVPLFGDTDDENPYLDLFYREPATAALHTQLHFLLTRCARLEQLFGGSEPDESQLDGAGDVPNERPVVADFMLDKDWLFAELTLDETEWWMYRRIHAAVVSNVPTPDLIVYLQAPVNVLLQRIERRGRRWEKRMETPYLQRLVERYERYFHDYTASPLLVINTADINLADDERLGKQVLEQIENMSGGRHFLNLAHE